MGRDFQKSTKNCFLSTTGIFSCDSEITFEKSKVSTLDLNLIIKNQNGVLKCLLPEYPVKVEPQIVSINKLAGNFSFSCKELKLKSTILSANCENKKNKFVPASLDLKGCVSTTEDGALIPGSKGFTGKDCGVTELGKMMCKNTNKMGKEIYAKYDLNLNIMNNDGKLKC